MKNMRTIHYFLSFLFALTITAFMQLSITTPCAADNADTDKDIFPHYSVIEPNVSFWKKIYSEYSINQSVIHDKSNPAIIYDVLEFQDNQDRKAKEARRKSEKAAVRKYSQILRHLAAGRPALTDEEKRVAALFGQAADLRTFKKAARNIRCQRGLKERFLEGIKISGAYIHEMRDTFRSYGLPEDLCYLPHVESSFRHWARSKCGAAGMWQFMRSTAKRFIRVDHLVDERIDPFRSTRAAAELLYDNYEKLGSWPLAITAYNHGAAGMERAVQKHGNFENIIRNYKGRRFKFASRNFYAEFLAARQVAKEYSNDPDIEYQPPVQGVMVKMPAYVSFIGLANLLNIAPSTLHALNPGLKRPVLNGDLYIPEGYEMRLPILDSDSFPIAMAAEKSGEACKIFFA